MGSDREKIINEDDTRDSIDVKFNLENTIVILLCGAEQLFNKFWILGHCADCTQEVAISKSTLRDVSWGHITEKKELLIEN